MDNTTLQEQIAATKEQLTAINAAILAITIDNVQSYTLNTGQSTQTVTKASIPGLQKVKASLMNDLCTLAARLTGSGSTISRPAW